MKIKRKVNDKGYIHNLLVLQNKARLTQICRDYKIKGFSKYRKSELVDFLDNSLTEYQLIKIFEISENLIYTKEFNSTSDRELEVIFEIIKNEYPKHRAISIDKKDFKQIDVEGNIQGKRLDFTITLKVNPNFGLAKLDFISILKENQEGKILHQIYSLDFGDFPDEWYFIQFLK